MKSYTDGIDFLALFAFTLFLICLLLYEMIIDSRIVLLIKRRWYNHQIEKRHKELNKNVV